MDRVDGADGHWIALMVCRVKHRAALRWWSLSVHRTDVESGSTTFGCPSVAGSPGSAARRSVHRAEGAPHDGRDACARARASSSSNELGRRLVALSPPG